MKTLKNNNYYQKKAERLQACLLQIAEDCLDVAKVDIISEAERRTWRTIAAKARRYAKE